MYKLNDTQIDFILDDIRARGVETEDLQLNLLDHVCCIIENQLEANGDFGQFYRQTISKFYNKELRELEDETQALLTFKHYYSMKKTMFISGFVSAMMLLTGGAFKVMHWPGANALFILGTIIFSFVFLPILFTLKMKERSEKKEKMILVLGMLTSIGMLVSGTFKFMHWPGANVLAYASLLVLILVFLPVYLINGLRNPANKINVIVTSILIIAGCGFLLVMSGRAPSQRLSEVTINQLRNEEAVLRSVCSKFNADSLTKEKHTVYDGFMKASSSLKDAITKAIAGVDYATYLNDSENIQPGWLMPNEFHQMNEKQNYLHALERFESEFDLHLIEADLGPGHAVAGNTKVEYLLNNQPHVRDVMNIISTTQMNACLALAK